MAKIIGNTTATPNPRPDWNQIDETKADYIKNKPIILTEDQVKDLIDQFGGDNQVQADWNQTDETQMDFIKNKPELGTFDKKFIKQVDFLPKTGDEYFIYVVPKHIYTEVKDIDCIINSDGVYGRFAMPSLEEVPSGTYEISLVELLQYENAYWYECKLSYTDLNNNNCDIDLSSTKTTINVKTFGDCELGFGLEEQAITGTAKGQVALMISEVDTIGYDEYIWVNNSWELIGSLSDKALKEALSTKVDKIEGRSLSTNDFTDEYKNKLDNLSFELVREYDSLPYRGQENVIYIIPKTEELFRKTVSFNESSSYYGSFVTPGIQLTDSEVSELANRSIKINCYVDLSNVTDYSVNYDGIIKYVDYDGVERQEVLLERIFFNISKIFSLSGTSIMFYDENIPAVIEGTETYVFEKKLASYDEYMWINNKWELLGDTAHELAATENPLEFTVTFSDGSVKTIQLVAPDNIIKAGNGEGSILISGDSSSTANGMYALSQGYVVHANSNYSHAEGYNTTATAQYSHAEGDTTTASGKASHSEGYATNAAGVYSHAEGRSNTVKLKGSYSHAEGQHTSCEGYASHTEGQGTKTSAEGNFTHAEGYYTIASGNNTHAEGRNTESSGNGSHAEGQSTKATSWTSHAEGTQTITYGMHSHAEGSANETYGLSSHAEGSLTKAYGQQSHAEGNRTSTQAVGTHTEGRFTAAYGQFSHAEGIITAAGGVFLNDHQQTGEILSKSGSTYEVKLSDKFCAHIGSIVEINSDHLAQIIDYDKTQNYITIYDNILVFDEENSNIQIRYLYSGVLSENYYTINSSGNSDTSGYYDIFINEEYIHSTYYELLFTVDDISYISVFPYTIAKNKDNNLWTIRVNLPLEEITADIENTKIYVAEPTSIGMHAEGESTYAAGDKSHAEGLNTKALGNYSHAEGNGSRTISLGSHAAGNGSIAGGKSLAISGGDFTSDSSDDEIYPYKGCILVWAPFDFHLGDLEFSIQVGSNYDLIGKVDNYGIPNPEYSDENSNYEYEINVFHNLTPAKITAINSKINDPATTRQIWFIQNPDIGDIDFGQFSHAEGENCYASAVDSHAEGRGTIAGGKYSHAEGRSTFSGYAAHAEGNSSKATGLASHAEGGATIASGDNAHSEGKQTKAIGLNSHAEGYDTEARTPHSHAEGAYTVANGYYCHAEGLNTKATGTASHAQGTYTEAGGEGSFTSGIGTKTCRDGQTAIGYYNETYGEDGSKQPLFVVGNGSSDESRSSAFEVFANGITVLGSNPKNPMDAATKQYVDTAITNRFNYLWQGKDWLVVGDDTTWHWGKSLTGETKTTYHVEQDEHYFNLISSKTGITTTQNGVTDTGFLGDVSTDISDDISYNNSMFRTGCFIDRIRRMNSVTDTAIRLVDYDVITIFGGALSDCKQLASGKVKIGEASNDIYTVEPTNSQTLCGRINTTINAILLKNPTIQIALVTPIPRNMEEETKAIWDSYVDAIIEVCHLRGIPCLDIYHNSALQPNFEKSVLKTKNMYSSDDAETDYIHLNAAGHRKIAPRFKAMLDTLIL